MDKVLTAISSQSKVSNYWMDCKESIFWTESFQDKVISYVKVIKVVPLSDIVNKFQNYYCFVDANAPWSLKNFSSYFFHKLFWIVTAWKVFTQGVFSGPHFPVFRPEQWFVHQSSLFVIFIPYEKYWRKHANC